MSHDPREEIRNTLVKLGLPGTGRRLPLLQRLRYHTAFDTVRGGSIGYVGALAKRWNQISESYRRINDCAHLVRCEVFDDMSAQVDALADKLGLSMNTDADDNFPYQHTSAQGSEKPIAAFFGLKNLAEIERICLPMMKQFGYTPTEQEQ